MNIFRKNLSLAAIAGFVLVALYQIAWADHHNFEFSPEKPFYVIPNPSAEENSEKQAINKSAYYGYRIYQQ